MKIRISSSVSNFKEKILKNWPVEEYQYPQDIEKPVCFFGMYHAGDYQAFINHTGEKMIFWCGSDILNLKMSNLELVNSYKNVCENKIEQTKLKEHGIIAEIHPTFAGNVNDYPRSCKWNDKANVWLCMHSGREQEYGLEQIKKMSKTSFDYIYHIYGIDGKDTENIKYHGQVSEEQLNKDIKTYQVAFRLNEFEGFSEVVAKGILLGQTIWSKISYENLTDREHWIKKLTDFKWLQI